MSLFAAATILLAGCAGRPTPPATAAVPSPTPIFCDDGPDAFTPMPADCVVPTAPPLPSGYTFPPRASETPWPVHVSVLPEPAPWSGSPIRNFAAGVQANLIGVGPDDSIAMLQYTNTSAGFIGSVLELRPDGTLKPGWPAGGVPVPVGMGSAAVGPDGTIYVAAQLNPAAPIDPAGPEQPTSILVTAIGPDGNVLPGWPYSSPAAFHYYDSAKVIVGRSGQACFMDNSPGVSAQDFGGASSLYCVGRDGKLLPGWPHTSIRNMVHPVFGPDGTLYVEQVQDDPRRRSEIAALGPDGLPKPGWSPWTIPTTMDSTILVSPDGRVHLMVMSITSGTVLADDLVTLSATGSLQDERALQFPAGQHFVDMALAPDGGLYLSTCDSGDLELFGKTDGHVTALAADGAPRPGWPIKVDGRNSLFISPDGSVWTRWEIWGSGRMTGLGIAAFEPTGKLRSGFPTGAPDLGTLLAFDSTGTAYAVETTMTGVALVKVPN